MLYLGRHVLSSYLGSLPLYGSRKSCYIRLTGLSIKVTALKAKEEICSAIIFSGKRSVIKVSVISFLLLISSKSDRGKGGLRQLEILVTKIGTVSGP
jgi:hypothetical protein